MGESDTKMIAIGIENFEKLRKENFYYIDTTLQVFGK